MNSLISKVSKFPIGGVVTPRIFSFLFTVDQKSDAAEAKNASQQGNHQKHQGPVQHMSAPSAQRAVLVQETSIRARGFRRATVPARAALMTGNP